MDHRVQEPLNVDLDLSPQSKPVQSFVGADIAEYRLYDCHTLRVDLTSFFTLDLLYHELREVDPIRPDRNHQALWSTIFPIKTFPSQSTTSSIVLLCTICSIHVHPIYTSLYLKT